ncbi:hypothetical protein F4823DRAFT_581675 [Ustulina deusta]|nr:hypothetical protein F4823DRAFT_581675 [Ustulina deusta]
MQESFDRSTGQTFLQWDVPAPAAMPVPWNRTRHPIRTNSWPQSCHSGAAPLVDMCLKVAAQHIDQLDRLHLQYLPIQLVGRIWEHVKQTKMLSVETWKLLASILGPGVTREEGMERYICPILVNHSISIPKTQPLPAYIGPLVSDTLDFLTHLTIAGSVNGGTAELLQLVQLTNLAVLEVIQPSDEANSWSFPRLTDSIVREWSTTPGAFPLLRILRVWGEDHTTRHSLRYIGAFPSLVMYDVAGRRRDWEEKSESVWKSKRWTWTPRLEDTLLRHFSLFEASIPDDVRELKSDVTIDVSPLVEYEAIEVPEIRLIRCQTEDPNLQEGLGEFDDTLSLRRMFRVWHLRGMYDWIGYSPYYGISDFLDSESFWGFFMYCYIGTLLSNRDLSAQGLEIGERALGLGHIVLPPRPMINLILGETTSQPTYNRRPWDERERGDIGRSFETQLTFVRHRHREGKREASGSATVASGAVKRPVDTSAATRKPHKKRQNVSNILESFNKG